MAVIIKSGERNFQENPNKIDPYRILSDTSITQRELEPQNLNFDLRQLNPGQYSAPYHFHRYAEELFMIVSGSATLRSPEGCEVVECGDLLFFERGEKGAHQLYNHTETPCLFLDVRSFIGFDVCEYPDSDKLLIAPAYEIFDRNAQVDYFDGEENISDQWKQRIRDKTDSEIQGNPEG